MRRIILLAAIAAHAWGQLQFFSVSGTTEAPLTSVYSLPGPFIVGVTQTIKLRVRNQSATQQAACLVRNASSLGYGFSFDFSNNPSLPSPIVAGSFLDLNLNFMSQVAARSGSASIELQYAMLTRSATCAGPGAPTPNLRLDLIVQVNSITTGAVVTLTQGGSAVTTVPFGSVATGQKSAMRIYVTNPGTNTLTIAAGPKTPLDSDGIFTITNGPAFPLTLNPTESAPMDIQFAPKSATGYSDALTFDAVTIVLTGTGIIPVFPTPTLVVDPVYSSASQPSVKITLPSPAPFSASGTLRVDFKPSAGSLDDSSILFIATRGRSIGFSFNQGDTVATIGTAGNGAFQTGTTAGTLTFSTLVQGINGQATATIQNQMVEIDATVASRPNLTQMIVQLNGFDNSKSISKLAFTFYDTNGVAVAPGEIAYDATKDFSQFFQASTAGGLFSLLASFPVTGSNTNVKSVNITVTNSVGTFTLPALTF